MFVSLRIRTALVFCLSLSVPAVAGAATVALAWNANPENNIGGYILVYGTAPGSYSSSVDVGSTTAHSIASLTSGTRYYFAVRAYNTSGVSGALSNEVNELASDAPPPPPPPPPPLMLVAAYGFSEASGSSALDTTANNNDGTLTGGALRTTAGRFGSALIFDGLDGIVSIPSSASLNLTSAYTLEAWVSPSVSGGWRTALMKNSPTGHTYVLYTDSGATGPAAHAQTTSDRTATAATLLPLNTWTHLAAVSDGTTLRLLVNGVQAATVSLLGAVESSTGAVNIGGNLVWGEHFTGKIDEVRIYQGALTDAQVQQDMITPINTDTTLPTVSVTSPAGGATIIGAVTLTATAADNVAVAGVQFRLGTVNIGAEDLTSPYSLTWNSATVANGSHTLTAIARDSSGNLKTSAAVAITVANDTVPPAVVSSSPANGASGVPTMTSVTVTFSEAINAATLTTSTFVLRNAANTVVPATVSYNAATRVGTLDPSAELAASTTYTATITGGAAGVKDVAGNPLAGNLVWSFATALTEPPPPPPPPPGALLVAAYGFGEASGLSATDTTANNNDGTLAGGVGRTTAGRFGKALVFDGIDGIVNIPSTASLDLTSAYTLEAWVSPSASGFWRTALMKDSPTGHTYVLYSNSDTTGPSAHAQTSSDRTATAAAPLPLNVWTHIAAVSDGTTLRLLVNGQQAASVSLLSATVSSTQAVHIGGNLVWGEYFAGKIDEVRIYSGALTDAQVQQDMITPVDPTDTTNPTVSISSPAAGASISGSITVTATAADNVAVAGVQFLLDGSGIGAEDLTAPYALDWNSGSVASGLHTLSATARDAAGNVQTSAAVSVTVFNDTVPPTVVSATPAAGASTVSLTANVTATFSEAITATTLTTGTFVLRDAGNAVVPAVVSYNATTRVGTLNPSASLTAATMYTATITGGTAGVRDVAGNPLASNFVRSFTTVTADTTPPTVTGVTPADGAAGVSPTTVVTAIFSEPMAAASITTTNVELRNAAGAVLPSAVTYNATARSATLTPSGPLPSGATYSAVVKGGTGGVRDVAGNVATGSTGWSFSVGADDGMPPIVLSVSPVDGSSGVPQTTPVTATFSEPMDPASITTATLELRNATGVLVAATVTYDQGAQSATLTPSAPLPAGVTYSALVKGGAAGVQDLAGNAPPGSLSWSFSVGSTDVAPPTVVSVSPANGASGVPQTTSVTATFSEPMASASITTANFELRNASGVLVAAAVTYNQTARSATLTPSAALTPGVTFTATIKGGTGGVRDLAGNVASGHTAWSFSVAAATSKGPVAVYGFDEGTGNILRDLSGNNLHGSFLGATWQTGRFGKSLEFNGVDNWLTVPANTLLDFTTAVTIEAWVYPTTLAGWRTVVFKETPTGHTYALYAAGDALGAGGHMQMALDGKAHQTTQLPIGQWSHLTTTYDGQSVRLFVNAVQVASAAASGPVVVSDGVLRIGGNNPWGEYFVGRIDEVRLYDRALGATEIAADMNTPASGWLAAAYGFDETAGSTAADTSGRKLDGTVTGATWTTGRFGNGLAFNGVDSWVTVPTSSWLSLTTGMTLEAWVYPTAGGGWRTVMLKETADGHTFTLYSDGHAAPGAHLQADTDVISEGTVPLPLDAWTHLAVTYDGTNLRLYTNGALTSTQSVTGVPVTSTLPLRIGGNAIWGEHFAGIIDEVRIYYRALTEHEIRADMAKPVR
jgi:Concanavalin A-like lectin/glucanases superfamily/Bacterial Ig-like domain/Bacterial Ig domain